MLRAILTWYLVLQGFALAGVPLAWAWLRYLPSRGYAAAKALGLLLTGVVFWWGSILHIWHNTTAGVLTAAGIVLGLGLWAMRAQWQELRHWWETKWRFVLTVELLFAGTLFAWAWVRAAQPQLETAGGEKWMEIAFLNAILRAPTMPPHDPWLSGYAISYYYLGYLLLSMLTRVAAIAPTVAFNLGCAGWYALVAVGAYGIVYDLLAPRNTAPRRILSALLGPLMLLLAGNGEGLLEVLHARGWFPARFWAWLDIRNLNQAPTPPFSWVPQRFFWWWQASRTLQDYTPWGDHQEVIDEFPAFSFLLGDMHPHVLALPFVLLVVALALNLYHRGTRAYPKLKHDGAWRRFAPLAGYALVLGALGFLNTWDLPIYWALMVGAMVLGHVPVTVTEEQKIAEDDATYEWPRLFERLWRLLPDAFVLGVLSIGAYFPFWYALRSQAGGILPNLFNATRPVHFFVMFTPLLIPMVGVLISAARNAGVPPKQIILWGVALVAGIVVLALLIGSLAAYPYLMVVLRGESIAGISVSPETVMQAIGTRVRNPWMGLALALAVSAALLALVKYSQQDAPDGTPAAAQKLPASWGFPLLMVLLGLLLTLAPEFVYLQDVFLTRMNTIFKFYFQAWVLWSLAGAWQLARWLTPDQAAQTAAPSPGRRLLTVLSGLMIAVGLVYTIMAIPARAKEHGVPWTLDGAAWLWQSHPQDALAIQWLNSHVEDNSVIVESPADEHRAYVYEGRVSAMTGLPTVLGWAGHQRQWRGNYDEPAAREQDLELLFNTLDSALARTILERYHVNYIYIGPMERSRYSAEGLAKFANMFSPVYDAYDVIIYQVEY